MSLNNWKLCCLCQIDTKERLISPKLNSKSSYFTLAKNLQHFQELGSVPIQVPIEHLDTGKGIETTLIENKACWHKTCFARCNTLKLQRAQKRKRDDENGNEMCHDEQTQSPAKRRSRDRAQASDVRKCFFCDSETGNLHRASSLDIDRNVRSAASKLNDWKLLAKLARGDMHAIDAYYHKECYTSLFNRLRSIQEYKSSSVDNKEIPSESVALSELVLYILESTEKGEASYFKLSDLAKIYASSLKRLGESVPERVNTTRLKERLLNHLPKLQACNDGREVRLAFPGDIGTAIDFVHSANYDDADMHFAKAAHLVRKDMFSKEQTFTGTFKPDCQISSVPDSLLRHVSMILEGPRAGTSDEPPSNASTALSQLLIFNSLKHARTERNSTTTRHETTKESPIAIYIALVIHAETRKRSLIDKLHKLGLCISYDRVLQISSNLGNNVCNQFERDGLVCPPKLRKSLFTTGAVDNIDHNPSARTAKDSFHGTAITLTQHPDSNFTGVERNQVYLDPNAFKSKSVSKLPERYTSITPVFEEAKKNVFVPKKASGEFKPREDKFNDSMKDEFTWLDKVERLLNQEKLDERQYMSWSAHFASIQNKTPRPSAITSLLPLFEEKASTTAMIQHSMKLVKDSTQFLNPGQVPVIVMDQPLYAIAKQIQWNNPGQFGEDKYLVMMGGLHIEMASLKMLGHWLCNSGWTSALVQANITTSGRADAILKASHITRSRYAHQISACALNVLRKKAYEEEKENPNGSSVPLSFEEWVKARRIEYPQFMYWSTALDLELLVLEFVRSIREGNFPVYIQVLGKLIPWMFVLDLSNYSRWLPVHIRDLMELERRHPSLHTEFAKGKFVVQKTEHNFSMIALDQNHEQENEIIKGDGGAVGLTENEAAFRRWMVAGPEIARVVKEFESSFEVHKPASTKHHEQTPSIQKTFAKDVTSLVKEIEEYGNPFLEKSKELIVLDTKEIMPEQVTKSVYAAKEKGDAIYGTFVNERLERCTTALSDTITRTNLSLFGTYGETNLGKTKSKVASLKSDCNLFARLYIACQSRDGNMQEFFKHENSCSPPSLSCGDQMRSGQKSDLINCLPINPISDKPAVDVIVLDAAAVVNMLPPGKCRTFQDYASLLFLPHISRQAQNVQRVDLVFDRYLPNSLKQSARARRGAGARRRVCDSAAIPCNWKAFLRSDENKKELFEYLAKCASLIETSNLVIISTMHDDVLSSTDPFDKSGLAPCNHEEADSRIFLHVKHASLQGHKKVMIRTVDTDVVVLAISLLNKLDILELWISFGVGKHLRYFPIHTIKQNLTLTEEQCEALPFFHALTGCDSVSFFAGKGKKAAFHAWKCFPEVTPVLRSLSSQVNSLSDDQVKILERFIITMYSSTCPHENIDEARQAIFSRGTKTIEHIPPTKAALLQHIKRAVYQAGHVWGQSLTPVQELPNPSQWGWQNVSNCWKPVWTLLPEASKVCNELIQCGCKKACRGLCKCTKNNLPCTALCLCQGTCYQE